jgi:hypothetical protein
MRQPRSPSSLFKVLLKRRALGKSSRGHLHGLIAGAHNQVLSDAEPLHGDRAIKAFLCLVRVLLQLLLILVYHLVKLEEVFMPLLLDVVE